MTVTVNVTPNLPCNTKEDNLGDSKKCSSQDGSLAEVDVETTRCNTRRILSAASSNQQSNTSDRCASTNQLTHNKDLLCNKAVVDNARTHTRGRQKNEDKTYKSRGFGNEGNSSRQKGSSKGLRDNDNSSSNGGNSGADGNGEDNDGSDDDDDEEYMEDDDDEEEEEEDDDEEESKNDDDEEEESGCSSKAEKSSNGVDVGKKDGDSARQRNCKQKTKQGEQNSTGDIKNQFSLMDLGFSVPAAELLDKLPNSLSEVEQSLAPAPPGTPISLHGVICHETMGGVLVLNIKWRNKIYSGSLLDCSRHAWATPRFQTEDEPQCEDKGGGRKGGKGKRPRSTSMTSSGSPSKEATPLKHKLRGRKKGGAGAGAKKNPSHKMLGKKRKTRNADDDSDDNMRHGKRSCTLKTSTSPQPSPTLIPCPEPGCDKKYKHINGLRYHQAHAHLEPKSPPEETNQSDDISTSTSPSPGEEFKEPSTKPSGKSRTSRMGLRSQSVSPTGSMSNSLSATSQEKTSDAEPGGMSKDGLLLKTKKSKVPGRDQDRTDDQESITSNSGPSNAVKFPAGQEEVENKESSKHDLVTDSLSNLLTSTLDTVSKELEQAVFTIPTVADTQSVGGVSAVVTAQVGKAGSLADTTQGSQEVWETVIDSGCSSQVNPEGLGFQSHAALTCEAACEDNINSSNNGKDAQFESRVGSKPEDTTNARSLSELGFDVEDISETEEEIDPGQDADYQRKLGTCTETEPIKNIDFRKKYESWSSKEFSARFSNSKQGAAQLGEMETKGNTKGNETESSGIGGKAFSSSSRHDWPQGSACVQKAKLTEIHSKIMEEDAQTFLKGFRAPSHPECNPSNSKVGVEKTKQPGKSQGLGDSKVNDEASKRDNSLFKSLMSLQAKSISHSAVEPPLTNTDTPSNRYKSFRCRNYGDESYDMNATDLMRSHRDPSVALAPIRNPGLLNDGSIENSSSVQEPGKGKVKREANVKRESDLSKSEQDCQKTGAGEIGPVQKPIKQERNNPEFSESKHSGNNSTISSNASPLSARQHSRGEPSSVDTSSNSFHRAAERGFPAENPVIKIEEPKETSPGKQKSSATDSSEHQDVAASKASYVDDQMQKPVFSRAPPALMQKSARAVAPTLPVGVAHPYPRAADWGTALGKAQDVAVTATPSVVSPVPYASSSGRIQAVASIDTDLQVPDLALKSKQLKSVRTEKTQEIPVGEVSPVALKRSPGPAMHAGLPSVAVQRLVHSAVRGVKASSYSSEQSKQESRQDPGHKHPDTVSSSAGSGAAQTGTLSKGREISALHQTSTASPSKSPDVEVSLEESDVVVVKEDAGLMDNKAKVKVEKERVREGESGRESRSESYKSQAESRSSEELRKLQLQQQLHLQLYQAQLASGAMPMDMAHMAYLQGIPYDQVMAGAAPAQLLSPEEVQLIQQQQRRAMLMKQEQEKSSKLDKEHSRIRTVDRPEAPPRSSEKKHDQEKDVLNSKTAEQERPYLYESGREYRGQFSSESSGSHQARSKAPPKPSSGEPPEKRVRSEQTKNEQYEQRQNYIQEEKFLQEQIMEQRILMYSKLERAQKRLGGSPLKKQSKEREEDFKGFGAHRDAPHIKQESRNQDPSSKSASKPSPSVEPGKSHSDFSGLTTSQESSHKPLSAAHSPRPPVAHSPHASRSPNLPRHSEANPDGRMMYSQFMPNQFQAYLQSQHLQPPGQYLDFNPAQAGAHLLYPPTAMLMAQHMSSLPPGLMMRMPTSSNSETNTMTSTASASRDRVTRNPHQRAEHSREYATLTRPRSHGDADTQLSYEKLLRLKEDASERPSSATGIPQDRGSPKGQHTSGRQLGSGRESTAGSTDSGWRDTPAHSRASIISSNLAMTRRGDVGTHGSSRGSPQREEESKRPRSDGHAEEEMLRRQRIMAEHGGHMPMHMAHGHMRYPQFDPAYAMMTQSQHAAMDHYLTKRQ